MPQFYPEVKHREAVAPSFTDPCVGAPPRGTVASAVPCLATSRVEKYPDLRTRQCGRSRALDWSAARGSVGWRAGRLWDIGVIHQGLRLAH